MKKIKLALIFLIGISIIDCHCLALPDFQSQTVSYNGANTISINSTLENSTYSSTNSGENALLISGGTSTLTNCTINKTGDTSDENSDFYGTNAALLVYNGATLNFNGGTINTNGGHANGVFAYGTGNINISDATIKTTSNNSGGLMVTGGGTLIAKDLIVSTLGNSSAAIRSDRGGGTLIVNNGSYTTSGVGSPAIYSTATITVNNAELTSTASEGAIVEGANSIILNNVKLIDTNSTLNGNSETYKNIFLYQSMSGDANEGTALFTANSSSITTNKGDSIFVTNTTATINLNNNTFVNNSGDFLRIEKSKWGNSGSNGGHVTLNLNNQKINGNIIIDSISTLKIAMKQASYLSGSIDSENQASSVTLDISSDSVFILESDSYLDKLDNETSDNSNIYLNGHNLYVNGEKVSANNSTYAEEKTDNQVTDTTTSSNSQSSIKPEYYIYLAVGVILVGLLTFTIVKKKQKNN